MLSAKLTHEQAKNKIGEQLSSEIKRLIDFARGDLQAEQARHLKRYFIGCLIKTDTQQNLLFPFKDKFAEIIQLLDLKLKSHKNLLELCCQLFVVFSERNVDESTLVPEEFHNKLRLLIKQSTKIESECEFIAKVVSAQNEEFQALWESYINQFLKNMPNKSQSTILSEEDDTLQLSGSVDTTAQFQEEVVDKKLLGSFQDELKIYKQKLLDRGETLSSQMYVNTCWLFQMDATPERLMQVEGILTDLNEQITNYQFFGLLTKYKRIIKDSYGLPNRYKGSALYQLLDYHSEQYEEMIRKHQVGHSPCMNL